MTDYSTWKVADLKAELKRRGIPQTGLRVKQNFIDKLVEEDAKAEGGGAEEAQGAVPESGGEEAKGEDNKEQHDRDTQESAPSQAQESQVEDKPAEESTSDQRMKTNGDKAETQDEAKGAEESQVVDKGAEQSQAQNEEPSKDEVSQQPQPTDIMDHQPTEAPVSQHKAEAEIPAEPVEQAPGDAAAQAPTPAEKPVPSAPNASEVSTELSTPLPTEELNEDTRKRKRRSRTPIPSEEAIANKKARAEDGGPRVLLPEDKDAAPAVPLDTSEERSGEQAQQDGVANEATGRASASEESRAKKAAGPKHDARFKGLFAPAEREQPRAASPPADTAMEDAEVEPALHPATTALYVGGLMRPLQPVALRNHIVSLASGAGAPNPDVIVDFYLDPIKTHGFVSFTSISEASRVRAMLHGTVYPNERNRKTLFVDFIPENRLQEWVDIEEKSRQRGGPSPRWEVKYDRTEDGVKVTLEEVDAKSAGSHQPRGRETSLKNGPLPGPPPTGPRASFDKGDRSGPPPESRPRPGQGFKPLDERFQSTTTKPKLYYLPVPRAVADRRLDRFDDILRKGSYPRRGGEETRRISFEDDDYFVDHGPEYSQRTRQRRGRGGGFGDRRGDRRSRW